MADCWNAGRVDVAAPPVATERLLNPVARRWALVVGVLAAALALALAVRYAGERKLSSFDGRIMIHIYAWYPDRRALAHRVADLGGGVAVFVTMAVLVVWLYTRRRFRAIALAVLGPTVAIVITEYVLKPAVDRRLLGYVTYPSGHSTGVFSVATVLAVLLLGESWRSRAIVRIAAVVVLFAVSVLVAISLVAAGYHVPTDTAGGAGVAIGTVLLLAVLIDVVGDAKAERGVTRR